MHVTLPTAPSSSPTFASSTSDAALLLTMVAAVRAAGASLLRAALPDARPPTTLDGILARLQANDQHVLDLVRPLLQTARPGAGWVEDELEGGTLPDGEWWIVDPVEGNINRVQGLTEWGVSATLVRDNLPVLTAVYEPVRDRLFTAVRDSGVTLANGQALRASAKTELGAALVVTGQAKPFESAETHRRMGRSAVALLNTALVVRMTVPATFQMAELAAGNVDAFWQHSDVRSGLAAGALLVREAGGTVTDLQGRPWSLASRDFLASAPGLHGQLLQVLSQAT